MKSNKLKVLSILLVMIFSLNYLLSGCSFNKNKKDDVELTNSPVTSESAGSDTSNNDNNSQGSDDQGSDQSSTDNQETDQQDNSGSGTDDQSNQPSETDNTGANSSGSDDQPIEIDDSIYVIVEEEELTEQELNLVDTVGASLTDDQLDEDKLIKATWKRPDRVLVSWAPDEDWIPEDGYTLYRVIADETIKLASDIGTLDYITTLAQNSVYKDFLLPAFDSATLTTSKLATLGISNNDQFKTLFTIDNDAASKIISTKDVFSDLMNAPAASVTPIEDRVPFEDQLGNQSISLIGNINTSIVAISDYQGVSSITPPALINTPEPLQSELMLNEILEARSTYVTKALVDSKFSIESGLGYEDDFKDREIAINTEITYILVQNIEGMPTINTSNIKDHYDTAGVAHIAISYGAETPLEVPENVTAFGLDNTTSLRWDAPKTAYGNSIITGYNIERKIEGDAEFVKINNAPVVIGYKEDGEGNYIENPVFYTDYGVENGDVVYYRVQSIDIFGRKSEYDLSNVKITIKKTIPPTSPTVEEPVLSSKESNMEESVFVINSKSANSGKIGVILTMMGTSDDTDKLVIYRSESIGTADFSIPEKLAEISNTGFTTTINETINGAITIKIPKGTSYLGNVITFFDQAIVEGRYYKYWVAAVDEFDNESGWSMSRIAGYPSNQAPAGPTQVNVNFNNNMLGNLALLPVGITPLKFQELNFYDGGDIITESTGVSISPLPNVNTQFVSLANDNNIFIGQNFSDTIRMDITKIPELLDIEFGNLPNSSDVHSMLAIENDDVESNSNITVSWYHYQGDNITGYNVFRAEIDQIDINTLANMSKVEIIEANSWDLVESNTTSNQFIDPVTKKAGRIFVYMVCIIPLEKENEKEDVFQEYAEGGWVSVTWEKATDSQVSYYRVYRAEVDSLTGVDTNTLNWVMVEDRLEYTKFIQEVDQDIGHNYIYKVATVSIWGVESTDAGVTSIYIKGTVPPSAPTMLIPMSQKDTIEVRFEGVTNAVEYIVFRHQIPKIDQSDISSLQTIAPNVFDKVFSASRIESIVEFKNPGDLVVGTTPIYIPGIVDSTGTVNNSLLQDTVLESASKFNTSAFKGFESIKNDLESISNTEKIKVYQNIVNKYGASAVMPYWNMDIALRDTIEWDQVHTISIADNTTSTGVFSYIDTDVDFGETYLYTVQAVSPDDLKSTRPEPVEAVTRKSEAFDKVTGLTKVAGENGAASYLSWNPAKESNLTIEESKEYIVGYLVYRSSELNGVYHQVSTLLTETEFYDAGADRYAEKYYKVKVVDIGGYISEFSNAVMIKDEWTFMFYYTPIMIPDNSVNTQAIVMIPTANISAATWTPVYTLPLLQIVKSYTISGYQLVDVILSDGIGSGNLVIAEKYNVPVSVVANDIDGSEIIDGSVTITEPVIIGDTGVSFAELSITTDSGKANVSGYAKNADISDSKISNKNLMGELHALEFTDATLTTLGEVVINDVENFWYKDFYLYAISGASIDFKEFNKTETTTTKGEVVIGRLPSKSTIIATRQYGTSFINIFSGMAQSSIGFDTVDNVMIDFTYEDITIDSSFAYNATFELEGEQLLQPVIPAGLCLLVQDATVVIEDSVVNKSKGNIKGQVILPFDKADDFEIINSTSLFANSNAFLNSSMVDLSSDFNKIMNLSPESASINSDTENILNGGMFQIGENVQKHGLLVINESTVSKMLAGILEYDDGISKIAFDVNGFDGNGFIVTDKVLSPTYVGEVAVDDESKKDYSSCVGVYGSNVVVDLTKKASYANAITPFLKDDDWMGIIVNAGQVALPPDIVKTEDDKWVTFTLSKEDLLYDQNGFSYQNQVSYQNELAVNLGEKAGEFKDAYIKSAFIDIYANKAYFEMTGSVGIPLFDYQRVNIHIYVADPEGGAETDENDDGLADDKASTSQGGTIISVAPTPKFDPSGTGEVLLKINGGTIQTDGITFDGTLDLTFDDVVDIKDVGFSGMTIPADAAKLTAENNADGMLGRAVFDQAIALTFYKFNMEARSISLTTIEGSSSTKVSELTGLSRISIPRIQKLEFGKTLTDTSAVTTYSTDLTIWGGMLLSDSSSLDTEEDFDRVVIKNAFIAPFIDLESCKTEVVIPFEGFIDLKMVGTPTPVPGEDSLVEYKSVENAESKFENACEKLQWTDLKVNARFGYDEALERTFYAISLFYNDDDDDGGISFGTGKVNKMTALVANNMILEMDMEKGTFKIPDTDEGLFGLVDTMKVDRDDTQSIFTFAAKCTISFETKGVKTSELRNVYLIVQNGPSFEIGGEYYTIKDVKALKKSTSEEDNLKLIGKAMMGYYQQTETLKISISIKELKAFGWKLSGDLGFEMSPYFWQLDIGYPTKLVAVMGDGKKAGFGISIRYNYEALPEGADEDTAIATYIEDHIKVQAMFGYKTPKDVEIGYVYFNASFEVGGSGEYYFDSEKIVIAVYLKGNAKGGVKYGGKKYEVIEVSLDANGTLTREDDDWNIKADMKIKYHLNLTITSISGTKNWDFEKDL